jgi:hypothetical protein
MRALKKMREIVSKSLETFSRKLLLVAVFEFPHAGNRRLKLDTGVKASSLHLARQALSLGSDVAGLQNSVWK